MGESENQLELKKRARRRLVGAVALALTAVIVLPMVMDHEPKPLTQDIQIRIPSQDAKDVSKPVANPAAAPADTKSKPSPEPAPAPDAPTATQKPAEPETAGAAPPPPAKPDVKPVPKPEPKPDVKPEPKAEAKDGGKTERQAMVEAILSGNEPPQPTGQFIVQLGAFGDPANVGKVRTRVKAAGFNSYAETVKGPKGKQTRVRAGPFASREAALQAAAKLKHAGLPGVVVPK
ncbi:MAG: SPOR domain-containing protein [Sterolibacteriaceae bacterium]|uniref:SPOR domain-containing protein n=1 Tax=Candidatus Methylophosphatis roskildensis TaxID=2899263 RepID=A0A9D7E7Y6_9PROT|nr:SPOR domain-containing protein [Candidatus Methylophosphatis roskildensis]MBK7235426.1 SPOR domain-containing protein [Sterolibacteriaceae bacterium]